MSIGHLLYDLKKKLVLDVTQEKKNSKKLVFK